MFGYIICTKSELNKEELERYQGIYCGLCKELKRKYGQAARFSLSYDLTFLALFLSALYEPDEMVEEFRCVVHPTGKRPLLRNKFIEYAADMTILLSYLKCIDDWQDEKKRSRLGYAKILEKRLPEIRKRYPRQYENVIRKTGELSALEKENSNVSDAVINCCGELLAEIFVYDENDFWSQSLWRFGYEIGRFIYLMDAVIDYESDLKAGTYNPFIRMDFDRNRSKEILDVMIGNAMEEFERMPIVRDEKILKNILYGGVWTQYKAKVVGKDKK